MASASWRRRSSPRWWGRGYDGHDSSDSPEEEEEVSLEELLMKLDTFEKKLLAKHGRSMIFSDDGDTTSPSSEPHTPESHRRSGEDSSDKDHDDFWM
jgi:hypothetical protein